MAQQLNVSIPLTSQSFYNDSQSKQNHDKINKVIIPKYGKFIDNTSKLTNVPSELIQSIIFIESAGNELAANQWAVGLMQLGFATASDVIVKEKGLGRLNDGEAAILKKYLGDRYSLIEKVKPKQTSLGKTYITADDLKKPEFNILVGTILLRQLLDEFSVNGKTDLAKVITIYNGGRQTAAAKKIIPFIGSTDAMLAFMPKETSDYVRKIGGVNGILTNLV